MVEALEASTPPPTPSNSGHSRGRLHSLGSRNSAGQALAPFASFTVAGNWVETRKKNLLAKISKHFGEGGRAISGLVTMGTFPNQLPVGEKFALDRAPAPTGPPPRGAHTCPGSRGNFQALRDKPVASAFLVSSAQGRTALLCSPLRAGTGSENHPQVQPRFTASHLGLCVLHGVPAPCTVVLRRHR